MKILEIKSKPTILAKIHERCYRSYQTLELVKEMLKRGDSRETILEVIEVIEHQEVKLDEN